MSSVDDLDCDLDDIGRGGGGGGGVGVGVGCGTPLNNAPGGSGGGSLSACGAREMTFIIAGENEEEDSDDDDDVIDASFDFGPRLVVFVCLVFVYFSHLFPVGKIPSWSLSKMGLGKKEKRRKKRQSNQ